MTKPITLSLRASLALLASMLSVTSPALADDTTPDAPQEFQETVEVSVVNVDVAALDRRGRPIVDLEATEFELLEDGLPVDIQHFSLIETPLVTEARDPVVEGSRGSDSGQPGAGLGVAGDAVVPAARLLLVLYVDNLHSRLFERNRALAALRDLLNRGLPAGTRISLLSYERGLHVRQPFTGDISAVVEALERMELAPAGGDRNDDERRRLIRAIERSSSPKDALESVRPFANQARSELWGSLGALTRTVDWLASLPGRKAMLFISGGLPLKPGAGLFNAIEYKWPGLLGIHEMMLFDQSEEFERIGRRASTAGVAIHTLDNAGVRPARSAGVEEDLKAVPTISANLDADIRTNLQLPLRQLADATGGRAILNRNRALPELEELVAELGTYYSLGFVPDRVADDRFHRIKVRVKRKGVVLRYREGYRDKPPVSTAGGR